MNVLKNSEVVRGKAFLAIGLQNRPKVRYFKFCEQSFRKTYDFLFAVFYVNLACRLKIGLNDIVWKKILF